MQRADIERYIKDEVFLTIHYKDVTYEGFIFKSNLNSNYAKAYGTVSFGNNGKSFLTEVENIKVINEL